MVVETRSPIGRTSEVTQQALDSTKPEPLELDETWRLSAWLKRPTSRPQRGPGPEIGVVVLVAVYNVVANLWLPPALYVPANLAFGLALVVIALRRGANWEFLGLAPQRLMRGLAVGGIMMAIIGFGIAVGVTLPATRELFEDNRVLDASTWEMIYQPFLRIPLGTAVFEELVFRGVFLGMFMLWLSPLWAVTWSSFLFGLWHVLPTGLTIDNSAAVGGIADSDGGLTLAVIGGVLGTWLIGYLFCWLRLRANSLLAPILFHTATNSFAYLGAVFAVRIL